MATKRVAWCSVLKELCLGTGRKATVFSAAAARPFVDPKTCSMATAGFSRGPNSWLRSGWPCNVMKQPMAFSSDVWLDPPFGRSANWRRFECFVGLSLPPMPMQSWSGATLGSRLKTYSFFCLCCFSPVPTWIRVRKFKWSGSTVSHITCSPVTPDPFQFVPWRSWRAPHTCKMPFGERLYGIVLGEEHCYLQPIWTFTTCQKTCNFQKKWASNNVFLFFKHWYLRCFVHTQFENTATCIWYDFVIFKVYRQLQT